MTSLMLEDDKWSFLAQRRGPVQTELSILAPTSALYILIFILGFTGNGGLLWLIMRNRSFHTPTNYYLVNLSISDLLVLLLGLPHDSYLMWFRYPYPFGVLACQVRGLLAEASMISSVLTITALTIERYLAICHPFSTKLCFRQNRTSYTNRVVRGSENILHSSVSLCCDMGRLRKVRVILTIIWILSIVCSLPLTMQVGLDYLFKNSSTTSTSTPKTITTRAQQSSGKVRIDESAICTVVVSLYT